MHPHSFRYTLGKRADERHDLEAARDLLRHRYSFSTQRHYVEKENVRALDPHSLFE